MSGFVDLPAVNFAQVFPGNLFRLRVIMRPLACSIEAFTSSGVVARWSSYMRAAGCGSDLSRISSIMSVTADYWTLPSAMSREFYFEADNGNGFASVSRLRREMYASVAAGSLHCFDGVAIFSLNPLLLDFEPMLAELAFSSLLDFANHDLGADSIWQGLGCSLVEAAA